jgi:hypothetical protein
MAHEAKGRCELKAPLTNLSDLRFEEHWANDSQGRP